MTVVASSGLRESLPRWDNAGVVSDVEWKQIRSRLRFGQVFTGTVVRVPRPGAIGVFVDIGLRVGGFVDVLLHQFLPERWPVEGTVTQFEVLWADERQQLRLKPVDPAYLRNDFAEQVARWRPGWPTQVGQLVEAEPADGARRTADCAPRLRAHSAGSGLSRRFPQVDGRRPSIRLCLPHDQLSSTARGRAVGTNRLSR